MLEKIREIICNYSEISPEEIKPESYLRELGLNSYDFMNIIASCEEEFSITIPDRDIHNLETVGDIIRYLEGKTGKE